MSKLKTKIMLKTIHNCDVGIVTQHNKAAYISRPLQLALNWQISTLTDFDTDALGTFSGETERTMTAKECAILKARHAAMHTSVELGLGSEGSFVPDQWGMMTINHELLACVDAKGELIAMAEAAGPVNIDIVRLSVKDISASQPKIDRFVQRLPKKQAAIVVVHNDKGKVIQTQKGLYEHAAIYEGIKALSAHPHVSQVEISYDLRAMHCPQRQHTIHEAATDLARRLTSVCPKCSALDFVDSIRTPGLPCETCQLPTALTRAMIAVCKHCHYQRVTDVQDQSANTRFCDFCNP